MSSTRFTGRSQWDSASPKRGVTNYNDAEFEKYEKDQLQVDRDWYGLDESGVIPSTANV